jgi:signal transduction histidine kinase
MHRPLRERLGERLGTLRRLGWAALYLLVASAACAQTDRQPPARSIVVLNETAALGPFYFGVYDALRSTLNPKAAQPVSVYLEQLDLDRFRGDRHEQTLRTYLALKYAEEDVRAIVALGSSALEFVLRLQSELWRDIPVVFVVTDDSELSQLKLPEHVTGRIAKVRFAESVKVARAIAPDLEQIAVVGDRWDKQTSYRHFRREIPAVTSDLRIIDLVDLPMRELKTRVATLPAHTAIIYTSISSDEDGNRYLPVDALSSIAEVANAPIVVSAETFVGRGGIGGYVLMPASVGRATAGIALRLLGGEKASAIPVSREDVVKPIFDWRQLQKWGVRESQLPEGSEVRFHESSAWDLYKLHIIVVSAALLLQASLISWLIYEHRRRRLAEVVSRNSMAELNYMNRRATAGELSASIAHEINQPLTGITAIAGATLRRLSAEQPDLDKVRDALAYIVKAGHAAADIVTSVRAMFKKDSVELRPVNINELIPSVLAIVRPDLERARVDVRLKIQKAEPAIVQGDPVQLRQVLLNLIMNAIEAMHSVQRRVLSVEANTSKPDLVLVSIGDTGPGIDAANVNRLFTPLFTTKPTGMGMGLSICRSIIENHGGRIWLSSAPDKGSIFQFELPKAGGVTLRAVPPKA